MVSPGPPFAGQRYVSDVLESLLDARAARDAVRAYVLSIVASTPPHLRTAVERIAAYIGGKCMGYPAIWFLEQALEQDPAAIIERCTGTLCVSLSTSIVDDVADGDETYGSEHLAMLYVLIGEAAFSSPRRVQAQARLHEALESCLDSYEGPCNAGRRGDRIGAFFAMIAADAVSGTTSEEYARRLSQGARSFGRLCAHVDDAMDVQRDLEHGSTQNVALLLLREYLGYAPSRPDLISESSTLDRLIGSLLATSVDDTIAPLREIGAHRAVDAMQQLRGRLEDWPQRL